MKAKRCWVVFLCVVCGAMSLLAEKNKELDEILNKLEKRYDITEAVFCRFEQEKKISQLKNVVQLKGQLYFRKPHFLKLEMIGDESLNIYINGEKIWIEDLDLEEVEIFDFKQLERNERLSGLLPPLFMKSMDEIKLKYEITLINLGGKKVIELKPGSNYQLGISNIRFRVDNLGRIPWMKVFLVNGDWIETVFRGWKKLPGISRHFFRYRGKLSQGNYDIDVRVQFFR